MRLDVFLQREFSLRSRTYAENLILRGLVEVDGRVVKKPSFDVPEDCKTARILQDENYASQGAYKLAEALRAFSIDLSGADCADIGCSNGGFTDLMLRRGAKSVLAVDVGKCALPESILADSRVTFLKANARELPPTKDKDFLSADLSFISLTLVLPALFGVLKEGGKAKARALQKGDRPLGKGESKGGGKSRILGGNDRFQSARFHAVPRHVRGQKQGVSFASRKAPFLNLHKPCKRNSAARTASVAPHPH